MPKSRPSKASNDRLPALKSAPGCPGLAPPVKVALAKAVTKMPGINALPGGSSWEPNWDGYRAVAIRDDNGATLWSRQGKDLSRYSVGVKRRRAGLWPSACADISARQVSFTCLNMSTSFTTPGTAQRQSIGAPEGNSHVQLVACASPGVGLPLRRGSLYEPVREGPSKQGGLL